MPAQVDRCVKDLMAKWKDDPSSRPKPKEEGQDAKSQAFAICNAAQKRSQSKSLETMLEGGYGPVLIGAAATNRPYIPRLEETQVKEVGGEKKLVVHLANPGFFNHPTGAFTLNHAVFSTLIQNFNDRVVGQREAYDCRHQPNIGAFGWFEKLWIQDKKLYGQVDPTPVGLEQIDSKMYLYSSMEFHRNYQRDDVKLDLENATEDFCVLDLGEKYSGELDDLGYTLDDPVEDTEPEDSMTDEEKVQLEQELEEARAQSEEEQEKIKALEKERDEAREQALKLEQEAVDSSVASVVELAQSHRDKDGKALPKPFVEWVSKVLKFEDFGKDEEVVKLSEGTKPSADMTRYLAGAIKGLIMDMPGTVPTGRLSVDSDRGNDQEFDFDELWDQAGEGD